MAKSRSRSIGDYRARVDVKATALRDTWLLQLKPRLRTELTRRNEHLYWETLIAMAHLDWSARDLDVESALQDGLRRYGAESDATRDSPPSAAFLQANPDGRFALRYLEPGEEATPMRLLAAHKSKLEEKLTTLNLINQFASATLPRLAEGVQRSVARSEPSPSGIDLMALKDEIDELEHVIKGVEARLPNVRQRPSQDPGWAFDILDHVPNRLRDHAALQLMRQRINDAHRARQQLEALRASIERVSVDDSVEMISKAISDIDKLITLDPEDAYRVITPIAGTPAAPRVVRLAWQDREVPFVPLLGLRAALVEIQQEQEHVRQVVSWVQEQAANLVGPLLDTQTYPEVEAFWEHLNGRMAGDRVLALWDHIITFGRDQKLETYLGGAVLRLEQARRQGLLKLGLAGHLPGLLQDMLRETSRGADPRADSETTLVNHLLGWYEHMRAAEPLSLLDLQYLVRKLVDFPRLKLQPSRTGQLGTTRRQWPTLSQAVEQQIDELVALRDRLTTVIDWVRDYQRNCETWDTQLWNLKSQLDHTRQQEARERLAEQMRRISPEFAGVAGLGLSGYQETRPPLPNRGGR